MTSSLVGSEMCIRDRKKERRRHRPCPHGVLGKLRGRGEGREGIFPAVSYTHLTLPTICSV
eukprot:807859-Prorocentrum_lima.AAC.1